jgi:tetratricopeptide (TPR) repeat protein
MKCNKKYYLIFIFLFVTFSTKLKANNAEKTLQRADSTKLKANNAEKTLQRADSLAANGMLIQAKIEYEKAIFFYPEDKNIQKYARLKKSQVYKIEGEFDKAIKCLKKINSLNLSLSEKHNIHSDIALCYYLNNKPQLAISELKISELIIKNDSLRKSNLPLLTFCYNDLKDWKNAKKSSIEYIKSKNYSIHKTDSLLNEMERIYSEKNLPKFKSLKKAINLSRFIPGAGQIYCGKITEGSICFLINASFLAFGGVQILNKYYITGYTYGFGILYKTYTGNMKRTETIVNKTNSQRHYNFNKEIINLLISLK